MICEKIMPHSCCRDSPKTSKVLIQNSSKVLMKKPTHKIKQPKDLKKSLHLEYYISTHYKNIHLQNCQYLVHNQITK